MKTAELRNLIKALGGPRAVGTYCGVTGTAVSHWKMVPSDHVLRITELARVRRVLRSDGSAYAVGVLRPDMLEGVAVIQNESAAATFTRVPE